MLQEQIDRNFGRLRGWLIAVLYDGKLLYSLWSDH